MSERLRVLQVIDSGGLYGAEKVVLSLMQEHQKLGVDVELASIAEPGMPEKAIEAEAQRLDLKWRRFELKKGLDREGFRRILAYARDESVSVIHSHGYKANILLALIKRRSPNIPVVATLHGWVSTRWWGRMKIYEWAECLLLPRLDRVIAVSEAMTRRSIYARRLGRKLKVTHNGIDVSQVEPMRSSQKAESINAWIDEFAGDSTVFVMVGRLSPEKDIATALRGIKELIGSDTDSNLVIFGEGRERPALELLTAELSLQNRVHFAGYCDCIADILGRFHGLIISSLTEGIPIVALEAMREGIPVIATRVGGLPELVNDGETGILVNKQNPKQLADAMRRLSMDPNLVAKFGAAGRRRVEGNFNIVSVAQQYLREYRGLS